MTDNATGTMKEGREKCWGVLKAIAFELKPFSLPTREGLQSAFESIRTNAGQITAELKRVAPEAVGVLKSCNPFKMLGLSAWLLGWALFIWVEFGAVYFIISAMAMIFINLGDRDEGEWSAYSVFNAGCRALLGTINAEQFEREIMRQNVAAPPDRADDEDHHRHQGPNNRDDDFVWVEPEQGMRDANEDDDAAAAVAAAVAAAADAAELRDAAADGSDHDSDDDDDDDDDEGDDAGTGDDAAARRGGAGGGRKVSGKRARRGFEGRRERQEERRLALQALGQDDWQ